MVWEPTNIFVKKLLFRERIVRPIFVENAYLVMSVSFSRFSPHGNKMFFYFFGKQAKSDLNSVNVLL